MASCRLVGGTNGSGQHIVSFFNVSQCLSALRIHTTSICMLCSTDTMPPPSGYVDTTVSDGGTTILRAHRHCCFGRRYNHPQGRQTPIFRWQVLPPLQEFSKLWVKCQGYEISQPLSFHYCVSLSFYSRLCPHSKVPLCSNWYPPTKPQHCHIPQHHKTKLHRCRC